MKKIVAMILGFIMVLIQFVYADTIVLNNGNVLECNIELIDTTVIKAYIVIDGKATNCEITIPLNEIKSYEDNKEYEDIAYAPLTVEEKIVARNNFEKRMEEIKTDVMTKQSLEYNYAIEKMKYETLWAQSFLVAEHNKPINHTSVLLKNNITSTSFSDLDNTQGKNIKTINDSMVTLH